MKQQWVYMEEYQRCACSQIEQKRADLLGYCQKHFTDRKRVTKLPGATFPPEDRGFMECG